MITRGFLITTPQTLSAIGGMLLVAALIHDRMHAQAINRNVSKTGTTGATFLEIPVGARAVAMGSAFVAIASDASSLYWNPAGAARLPKSDALFSHTNWIANLKFDYAAFALPLREFGTLGLSFTALNSDDMPVRTVERPEGTGEFFSAGSFAVGIHYARNLSDRFSLGITGKYISESIWHMQAQAFAIDLGALFTTEFLNGMRIGALISNFGTDIKLSGRDTRTFRRVDPTKLGSNDQIPENIELDSWPLPLNFQFGIAVDLLKDDEYTLTVAADALHPSGNYESVNAGIEYSFENFLFLRGGYRALGLFEREGGLSYGGGIVANMFGNDLQARVEYAYSDFGRLKAINVLTVSVVF